MSKHQKSSPIPVAKKHVEPRVHRPELHRPEVHKPELHHEVAANPAVQTVSGSLSKAAAQRPALATVGVTALLAPLFSLTDTWLDQVESQTAWWLDHGAVLRSNELVHFAKRCGEASFGSARAMLKHTQSLLSA